MILLDSSVLVAFFSKRDSLHARSAELLAEIESAGGAAIPSPVIFETSSVLRKLGAAQRDVAAYLAHLGKHFRILETNRSVYPGVFKTYSAGRGLSLVDCLLLELAQLPAVTVATLDEDLARTIRAKKTPTRK